MRGNFGMNVSVRFELPPASSVTLKPKRADGVKGYEHATAARPQGASRGPYVASRRSDGAQNPNPTEPPTPQVFSVPLPLVPSSRLL